jgi:putative solute:sodium symporter small subunit
VAEEAEKTHTKKEGIMALKQDLGLAGDSFAAAERKGGTLEAYWKKNLTYVTILLSIWFVVSYVCGILLADALSEIYIGGFRLGFWFANQGSEVVFVLLIIVYVRLMNRLDKEFDVEEK